MSATPALREQGRCRGNNRQADRRLSVRHEEVVDIEELESVMRNICELLEAHPEWRQQSAEERFPSILQALRQL
jgi:hypothetical protein